MKILGRRQRRHQSSSLQSLGRGRKTEVAFLNGAIVDAAKTAGIPTPVNEALVHLVGDIENGRRRADPSNLAWLPL